MFALILTAALAAVAPQAATTHAHGQPGHGKGMEMAMAMDDCCKKPCCNKKASAKADCCADMHKGSAAKRGGHRHH